MKIQIITLCFVCNTLLACEGGKSQNDTKETPQTTPKVEAEAKPEKESTPTKTEKLGMQALIEAYFKRTGEKATYGKKDFANGYVEFTTEGAPKGIPACQFAYYITKDGKETLAVTIPQCMQACNTSLLFFEMMNNELVENPGKIEAMKDMNQFMEVVRAHLEFKMTAEEKQKEANGEMALYDEVISLPQQGTTIKIIKHSTRNLQKQTVAELQFNEKTGKFKFVKL